MLDTFQLIWYKFMLQIWAIDGDVLRTQHGHDGILYIKFCHALHSFIISLVVVSCLVLMPIYLFFGDQGTYIVGALSPARVKVARHSNRMRGFRIPSERIKARYVVTFN